jgi:anti-sigma factor RsiW
MTMDCAEARTLIDAYADDELDAATSLQLDGHLASCQQCAASFAAIGAVKAAAGNPALRFKASEAQRNRALSALGLPRAKNTRPVPWRAIGIAASILLTISTSLALLNYGGSRGTEADDVLASHLRSMQANHLLDVPSGNPHMVKPWLDGHLEFAPPVPELEADGFKLEGGRMDYIKGHPAAALVYGRRLHVINLFICPFESGEKTLVRQGFNLIHWSGGGMGFWAVSDLNAAELQDFVRLYRAHSAPIPASAP